MKENLSPKWTLPTKIFNFLLTVIPLATLITAFNNIAPDETPLKILVVVWSLFFLFINYRLKFVSVDENNLYVSRLLREKMIPLAEIGNVFLTTIGFPWVGFRFKSATVFGKKIFFMPMLTAGFVYSFQRFHPVVEELKNLVKDEVSQL